MNRRSFLKMLGLFAIAPFIPLPKPEHPNLVPTLTDKEVEKIKEEWGNLYTGSYGVNGVLTTNVTNHGYITYSSVTGRSEIITINNPYVIWEHVVPSLFEKT